MEWSGEVKKGKWKYGIGEMEMWRRGSQGQVLSNVYAKRLSGLEEFLVQLVIQFK